MSVRSYIFFCLGILLMLSVRTYAQCPIKASATEICRGNTIVFKPTTYADRYEWRSENGFTESKSVATFLYDQSGKFWVHLGLYDASNSMICEDSVQITVYDLPTSYFNEPDTIYICNDKAYCFDNLSTPGINNAPIVSSLWSFGDGDVSTQLNTCHAYDFSGEYKVFLKVKDSNNCEASYEQTIYIDLYYLEPRFSTDYNVNCPVTSVKFNNLTDTTNKEIVSYKWDFGDGTQDTSNWTDFIHQYDQNGVFSPVLYVSDIYGCEDSFVCTSCAKNIIFYFNVTSDKQVVCFNHPEVQFTQIPNSLIHSFTWNFGDTGSKYYNYNSSSWSPWHTYAFPGIYDVKLSIAEGDCKLDTTLCNYVIVNGPYARINLDGRKNSCNREREMPMGMLDNSNSYCYNPANKSIDYTTLTKTSPFVSEVIDAYCLADTMSTKKDSGACGIEYIYTLGPPNKVVYVYDSFLVNQKTYVPGDPLPVDKIYYPPFGSCDPQVMHDTDFYKMDCSAPNYVRFTNNTIKFRYWEALDNYPPYEPPGSLSSDECLNKAYPWASDSLSYFWDFGDYYAPSCTSTVSNPNINCRYSTEVQPWHLYNHDGCFKVQMTATDPITGCSSVDTAKIVMEPPDAGWDTNLYDRLNWISQRYFDGVRKGFILKGLPCENTYQNPNFEETLPSCARQDWGIVFDSARDCDASCQDTVIFDKDDDGIPDTSVYSYKSCSWVTRDSFEMYMSSGYKYDSGGCKTLGVWIQSGDCIDTFWFHNYKYIHEYWPDFYFLTSDSLKEIPMQVNADNYVCTPFYPILTAKVKDQLGVVSYHYEIEQIGTGKLVAVADDTIANDTAYRVCNKHNMWVNPFTKDTVYYNCFYYPPFGCDDDPFSKVLLDTLKNNFVITDTFPLLNLHDTLFLPDPLVEPGNYEVRIALTNIYGCVYNEWYRVNLGFQSFFVANDTVVCAGGTVKFYSGIAYFGSMTPTNTVIDWDLDGDGIFEVENTVEPRKVYDSAGAYTIRMRVRDPYCGLEQIIVKENYLDIVDVVAGFDTLNAPSICAPEVVGFKDTSLIRNGVQNLYDTSGNLISSVTLDKIISWEWDFGDGYGQHSKSYKQHPTHVYPDNGSFDVSLIVQTSQGCTDTMTVPDYIVIDGPKPRFVLLDTLGCVPYTVRLVDTSHDVSSWIWDHGDGNQSSGVYNYGDTFEITYDNPGIYYIYLTGIDSVYNPYFNTYTRCSSTYPADVDVYFRNKVKVLPVSKIAFTSDTMICSGEEIQFTNLSSSDFTSLRWDFGDGTYVFDSTANVSIVTKTYYTPENESADTFIATLNAYGAECPDDPKETKIYVLDVLAGMFWDSTLSSVPRFCFQNTSIGGTKYYWKFQDGKPSRLLLSNTDVVCTNFYDRLGLKKVCLYAENGIGCKDTVCVEVENDYEFFIYIPNIFTPGVLDGHNDQFTISSKSIENYDLKIFNRWGELVFISHDPKVHWDGIEYKSGKPAAGGTYYFTLDYNFFYLEPETYHGTCTLIR